MLENKVSKRIVISVTSVKSVFHNRNNNGPISTVLSNYVFLT